jgi:YNFM family putative membrane transporter
LFDSLLAIAAGVACLTFGFFAAHSVTSSWVGHRARTARAQASSLYLCLYYLGASVIGAAAGLFWQRDGWTWVALFLLTLVAVALLLAQWLGRISRAAA